MPAKTRFQVMLDPEQLQALRDQEAETGASIGELIRRAIDAWLEGKKAGRKRADTRRRP